MAQYRQCPHCGVALDPGEKCDCRKEEEDHMERIGDHPVIARTMATGYPFDDMECWHYCPVCGRRLDWASTVYRDRHGEIFGCEACVRTQEASDVWEDDDDEVYEED